MCRTQRSPGRTAPVGSPVNKRQIQRTERKIGQRGQGLVEFGLTLPILILLAIGALDFGMGFYAKVVLTNSAREGANYMVYNRVDGMANSFALVKEAVVTEGANLGFTIDPADIDVSCELGGAPAGSCPSRSTVIVTVTHSLPLLVDVIFQGPLELQSEARMLVP
ncbi:MAG TPA: TadE family protein [Anaerolineae bacterium]|nr:TadE family protein [Anaerolineae bacterium]